MGIVLNEERLVTAFISATWSPTTTEVSGPDCMGIVDIDAETGTEIGREVLGTSIWAVASA